MVVVDLQRMKRVLWMLVKLFSYSSCNIIIDAAKAHITDQNIKVLEFYIYVVLADLSISIQEE